MPYLTETLARLSVSLLAATITLVPFATLADTFDLANTSLEDLLNIEVTSVTKSAQKLLEAPSAIYVITAEDIRRSGYTVERRGGHTLGTFRTTAAGALRLRRGVDAVVDGRDHRLYARDI